MNTESSDRLSHWRRYRALYLLVAVTLMPILASYFAYFVLPPTGRTNYGTLIEPQRPVPAIPATAINGDPFDLRSLKGKWVMIIVDGGACDAYCESKLFHARQQRTMTGKEREQIERVWLITDHEPLSTMLLREYEGTHFVRVAENDAARFLPLPAAAGSSLRDHIWLVDPLGNLMLRWPRNPDPKRTKGDISRLLKASSFWTRIERTE
jgi:hypothetical protein